MTAIRLSLCGDVMLGRGIDQILPHAGNPELREPLACSALEYVELAERAGGPIPTPVAFAYPWGDALVALSACDARVVNLETSVTQSRDFQPKGINYRMNPANARTLTAAHIDCCVLANNHVMDFGVSGLLETLATLRTFDLGLAGAGHDLTEATTPALIEIPGNGRLVVFAFGSTTSGIPPDWAAGPHRPGVWLLPDLSSRTLERVAERVGATKRRGDVVVASIHWGANWGYGIAPEQRRFARALIDGAAVDVVHGHSSHHVKAMELHAGKLILYGCGDFINDYEGIGGHDEFRPQLALLFLPTIDVESGRLAALKIGVFRSRRFRLVRATLPDTTWVRDLLARESGSEGPQLAPAGEGTLECAEQWASR